MRLLLLLLFSGFFCLQVSVAQTPALVKDINSGRNSSSLANGSITTGSNGIMYFWANDGSQREKLWRSDGTTEGTYVLNRDIYADPDGGSFKYQITVSNNRLVYFLADDGVNGVALWRSDGTATGTFSLKATNILYHYYESYSVTASSNGIVYFWVNHGDRNSAGDDYKLWRSDGTVAGTYVLNTSIRGLYNYRVTASNTGIVFFGGYDTTHGHELWRSDGTTSGTYLLRDIGLGANTGYYMVSRMAGSNGLMYFWADGGLWCSNGTTTGTYILRREIRDNYESMVAGSNGIMYFWAEDYSDGNYGYKFWRSDGTPGGTYILKDVRPGTNSGMYDFRSITADRNGLIYFRANDGVHGDELWRSNGTTSGTYMLKDVNLSSNHGYIGGLVAIGNDGIVYFRANDGLHGNELWRSDGTTTGTYLVKDINLGANEGYLVDYSDRSITVGSDGIMYFGADDGTHGYELWRSNGTAAGTYMVKDFYPGASSVYAYRGYFGGSVTANSKGIIYFWADDGVHGIELWKLAGEVSHLHQLPQQAKLSQNKAIATELQFSQSKLLAIEAPFKVCADGSAASIFRFSKGGATYNYANLTARIKDSGLDTLTNGRFIDIADIPRNADSLVVRYRHPNHIVTSTDSKTLTIELVKTGTNEVVDSYELIVYRAPVLMVHGLWAKDGSFSVMEKDLSNSMNYGPLFLKRVDYSSTNYKNFSVNVPKISTAIQQHIQQLRDWGVSAGRVDYVGHSMGGILGRLYLQDPSYRDDIHKLITINTPHSGSEMANFLKIIDAYSTAYPSFISLNDIACFFLLRLFTNNTGCNGGAIDDLAVNSTAIRNDLNGRTNGNLNRHKVPSHAIVTTSGITLDEIDRVVETAASTPYNPLVPTMTLVHNIYSLKVLVDATGQSLAGGIFDDLDHDLIVSMISQRGGLTGMNWTFINNQMHMGSPANSEVVNKVKSLLDASLFSPHFCQTGFNPAQLDFKEIRPAPSEKAATPSITVLTPNRGEYYRIGSTIDISVSNTGLSNLWTMIEYNQDSMYVAKTGYTSVNYRSMIGNTPGKRSIIAIGKTPSGTVTADSSYFYVEDKFCQSLQSGDWNTAATWSCGHVPTLSDFVIIGSSHVVGIATPTAQARLIQSFGVIRYLTPGAKLTIKGAHNP